MRLKVQLILTLFLIVNVSFSQSNKKVKKYKIKSVSEIVIDSSKQEFRESFYKFDKNGNVIFEEEFSKKKKFKLKNEYVFDKKNRVTEQIIYNEKGAITQIIKTSYSLELPINISVFDKDRKLISITENKYDGFGDKIQEITKDSEGKIVLSVEYSYNEKGLKISRKTFNASNVLIEEKKYTYEY
jgi:lipopolysaccharide export LptBFGC system permease protein LptF